MDLLRSVNSWSLLFIVFLTVNLLYLWGPIYYISVLLPFLWSLPAIAIVSGISWNLLEAFLGNETVNPENKAVFITGCDTGFGNLLAKRMAGKGYIVYAGCLFPGNEPAVELSNHKNIRILGVNVSSDDSLKDAEEKIRADLKGDEVLWGVVANAGISLVGPLEWCSMKDVQRLFDVNVLGVVRTVKTFLPLLRKSRGRFVITASSAATISCTQLVAYSMTKAAVKCLSQGIRREVFKTGIYVSSVEPCFYRTPMVSASSFAEVEKKWDALSEELRNDFSPQYLDYCRKEYDTVMNYASEDLSYPIECFEHALTSKRPRPSYMSDKKILRYIIWPLIKHLPDEVSDFVVKKSVPMMRVAKRLKGEQLNKK